MERSSTKRLQPNWADSADTIRSFWRWASSAYEALRLGQPVVPASGLFVDFFLELPRSRSVAVSFKRSPSETWWLRCGTTVEEAGQGWKPATEMSPVRCVDR